MGCSVDAAKASNQGQGAYSVVNFDLVAVLGLLLAILGLVLYTHNKRSFHTSQTSATYGDLDLEILLLGLGPEGRLVVSALALAVGVGRKHEAGEHHGCHEQQSHTHGWQVKQRTKD